MGQDNNPQLLFVAGPNGAGKSTFSKDFSKPGAIIFDVDKVIPRIVSESPGMPKKQVYQAATDRFYKQAEEATMRQQHFTLETNFRDEGLPGVVATFKQRGYTTNMIYLALESIEQSTLRVNRRVLNGGHFVDHKNIRQNYDLGLQYLERFADCFDNLMILEASMDFGKFKSLLKIEEQQLVYLDDDLPVRLEQTIINITDLYRNNSRDYYLGR